MVQVTVFESVGNFSHGVIVACLLGICKVRFKNYVVFCSLKTRFASLKRGFFGMAILFAKFSWNHRFWRFAYFTTSTVLRVLGSAFRSGQIFIAAAARALALLFTPRTGFGSVARAAL